MQYKIFHKSIALILLLVSATLVFSCQKQVGTGALSSAYTKLYDAVKSKDPEKIKAALSKNSLAFAEFAAAQQKKTVEEVIKNGFTASTFADSIPEMRDERIKDGWGALEVWNAKDKIWEDLPFINESTITMVSAGENRDAVIKIIADHLKIEPDKAAPALEGLPKVVFEGITNVEAENLKKALTEAGATVTVKDEGWKFAMGDAFKGSYQKPALGQAVKEQMAANEKNPNLIPGPPANMNGAVAQNSNTNVNVNTAQVDPIKPVKKQKSAK